MTKAKPGSRFKTHAFTIAEVMIASMVSAFAVAATLALSLQSTKTYFTDVDRLTMNHDMRRFTQKLVTDITEANHFFLYRDFSTRNVSGADAYVQSGQSGDFLLLVTLNTATNGATTVTKLVGYYRDIGQPGNVGTVHRFELDNLSLPAGGDTGATINAMDTLLTAAGVPVSTLDTHPVFAPSVIGNANDSDNSQPATHLFYDLNGIAVMINGQIQDQGNNSQTKALDTYNLTVLVRG